MKVRKFTCACCGKGFSFEPILLPASITYGVKDSDSSGLSHNPGSANECPRTLWEYRRKQKDKYTKSGEKIFKAKIPYCSERCVSS